MGRYFRVSEGEERYGPKVSAWRKWIANDSLGEAVVRCGRLVMLDSAVLDERLVRTGKLLVENSLTPEIGSRHTREGAL